MRRPKRRNFTTITVIKGRGARFAIAKARAPKRRTAAKSKTGAKEDLPRTGAAIAQMKVGLLLKASPVRRRIAPKNRYGNRGFAPPTSGLSSSPQGPA